MTNFDDDLTFESVKDILPIEYNRHCNSPSELAYIEIFNEALKNLQDKQYSLTELFHYCLDVCHKIFSLSEFRYGKPAKDIPNYIWKATAKIFDLKSDECTDEDLPNKKYHYRTAYSDFPTFEPSLSDMAEVILKAESESATIDTTSKKSKYDSLFQLRKNYFEKFFGLKFEESSDKYTQYENLRLLKILYDCVYSVDLAYLLHMSLIKQHYEISNAYTKAFSFIKERILLRNSKYFIGFYRIMDLEKYSNAIRSFINSFSERIIFEPLQEVNNTTVSAIRNFCVDLYQSIIENINNLGHDTPNKITDPFCIQIYAYEHFLLTDIDQPDYAKFYSKIFVVEAKENFYNRLANFLKSRKFEPVALAEIPAFIENYQKDLLEILYPKTIEEKFFSSAFYGKFKAQRQRLKRHQKDYEIIGRIYNLGVNKPAERKLSVFEIVLIIYLYETLSDNATDIPLYSGYNCNGNYRDLKIKALVKNLRSRSSGQDSNLPDEQYFLACYWITEQMNTLINYRTVEIQRLREQMKIKILNYWLNRYPLITEEGLKIDYDELIETILPHKTYETIFKKYFD